jgi:hypothetical protein
VISLCVPAQFYCPMVNWDPSQNTCSKDQGGVNGVYEQCTACGKWRELEPGAKKWPGTPKFRCRYATWSAALEIYVNKCDAPESW